MTAMSNYLENALINLVLRNTSFSPPANVYISLHTADPAETGANEVSGGSYARVAVSTTGGFTAPSNGATENVSTITFPTATASWGTVTHVGIWDAATLGNFLLGGALSSSRVVNSGDTVQFNAGALDITFS